MRRNFDIVKSFNYVQSLQYFALSVWGETLDPRFSYDKYAILFCQKSTDYYN